MKNRINKPGDGDSEKLLAKFGQLLESSIKQMTEMIRLIQTMIKTEPNAIEYITRMDPTLTRDDLEWFAQVDPETMESESLMRTLTIVQRIQKIRDN